MRRAELLMSAERLKQVLGLPEDAIVQGVKFDPCYHSVSVWFTSEADGVPWCAEGQRPLRVSVENGKVFP